MTFGASGLKAAVASTLSGCAMALIHLQVVAAPHPDDPPEQATNFVAPAWANSPQLGRARTHTHKDGHRCEIAHAPLGPTLMAPRPLPVVQQLQTETEKSARISRQR